MKCPICGCKMKEEFMCPYCKITGNQVKTASNKKAKEKLIKKDKEGVYNSSYLPSDVNNTRLLLITLFGGPLGIHYFYVGKFKTALYVLLSCFYTIIFYIISEMIFKNKLVFEIFLSVGYVLYGIALFMWMSDFVKVCFKKFSMPVVLGDIEQPKKEIKRKK